MRFIIIFLDISFSRKYKIRNYKISRERIFEKEHYFGGDQRRNAANESVPRQVLAEKARAWTRRGTSSATARTGRLDHAARAR